MSRHLTAFDTRSEIDRLVLAGYRMPEGATAEGLAKAWAEAMNDVSVGDFQAGVSAYLRDGGPHWPKPSEIRKRALEARTRRPADTAGGTIAQRYWAWEAHKCVVPDHGTDEERQCSQCKAGCPVCQAVLQQVPSMAGRLFVVHDAGEHNRQKVGWVGLPYSREATEMYAAAAARAPRAAPRESPETELDRRPLLESWRRRQYGQLDALMGSKPAPDSQAAD